MEDQKIEDLIARLDGSILNGVGHMTVTNYGDIPEEESTSGKKKRINTNCVQTPTVTPTIMDENDIRIAESYKKVVKK